MPSDRATTAEAIATMVDVGDGAYDLLITDGPSIIARLDQIAAAYAGQQGRIMASPNQSEQRRALVTSMNAYNTMMTTALLELAKSDGVDIDGDPTRAQFWRDLRDWMEDDNYYVTGRGWTRGSEPSITNLSVWRLTTDRNGEPIESGYPQVITTMVRAATGNQAAPSVRVYGEPAGLDAYELLGNGFSSDLTPVSPEANSSGNLLTNPSLRNDVTNGGDITALDGWTLSATDEWVSDTSTQLFREGTRAIKTTTEDAYIEQTVRNNINPDRPYLPVVAVYLDSVGSGDAITISWGGKSQTFDSVTNSAWVLLAPDRDQDLWLEQFDDASNGGRLRVTFEGSSGTCFLGWVGWVPMRRLGDYMWWAAALGDGSPLAGASGTTTDSLSAAATLNHILPMLYPNNPEAYLKTTSDTGSTQIDDLS